MSEVYIFLADGFEEVEALTVVDMLRRAEIQVAMVSVMGSRQVASSHQVKVEADCLFHEADFQKAEMLVLPGGMPGTKNLAAHKELASQLRAFHESGRKVAAICAAPMVLGENGILEGKRAVCYPGFEEHLKGAKVEEAKVAVDGNVITSRGMGTAIEFSAAIVASLRGEEKAKEVLASILY